MVALATVVYPSATFSAQLATNQRKQNHPASRAVSLTVNGGNTSSDAGSCRNVHSRFNRNGSIVHTGMKEVSL